MSSLPEIRSQAAFFAQQRRLHVPKHLQESVRPSALQSPARIHPANENLPAPAWVDDSAYPVDLNLPTEHRS